MRPDRPDTPVTVKLCGNVIEVRYVRSTSPMAIKKLSAEKFIDLRTGEVKEICHTENRAEDKASVAQSLRKLRDLINANLVDQDTALWVTLTYAENMRDPKRLYEDYRCYWQRLRYYLNKRGYPSVEYIAAAEPQGRGAWHLHCLFLFPGKAPFIPNDNLARIWGHGFTKTKSLKGVDNPGLYLTAYLGDMELTEAVSTGATKGRIVEAETTDEHGQWQKKAIIKGARLRLYPPGFNLYRCSRGVKRPVTWTTTEAEAQAYIGDAPLTFEKTIALKDEVGQTKNIINYRQYNRVAHDESGSPNQ